MEEDLSYWGVYGGRSPLLEEKFPVTYQLSYINQLNSYIDALLLDTKDGTDRESDFIKDFTHKVLPLVYHPIEFKNIHEAALQADMEYEKRHTPPYTFHVYDRTGSIMGVHV